MVTRLSSNQLRNTLGNGDRQAEEEVLLDLEGHPAENNCQIFHASSLTAEIPAEKSSQKKHFCEEFSCSSHACIMFLEIPFILFYYYCFISHSSKNVHVIVIEKSKLIFHAWFCVMNW